MCRAAPSPTASTTAHGCAEPVPLPSNASVHIVGHQRSATTAPLSMSPVFSTPNTLCLAEPQPGTAEPRQIDAAALRCAAPMSSSSSRRHRPTAPPCPISWCARKRSRADGSAPTLLYGYGGFQVSMTPSYLGAARQAVARKRRRLCRRQYPRRRRVRPDMAPGGAEARAPARLRRFHRGRRGSDPPRHHQPAPARHHGRLEWRPVDGRRC